MILLPAMIGLAVMGLLLGIAAFVVIYLERHPRKKNRDAATTTG